MTKELAHALQESIERIGNLETLVRVVLSGERRGMVPPAERIDIRPVLIKEKLMLQVSSNDGRAVTTKNIDFDSSEDSSLFNQLTLSKYDAIIFSNSNNEVFDNDEQKIAFQNFIKKGGGFMAIHSASAVERDWPWYWSLVGGKFVRHAPHQEFDAVVVNKKHSSTYFLDKVWKVKDECYFFNNL